jgi:hypothetical protein
MKTLFVGTVADVDDNTAGLVVASGRGSYVKRDDDGKYERAVVDTTPVDPAAAAEKAEKTEKQPDPAAAAEKAEKTEKPAK